MKILEQNTLQVNSFISLSKLLQLFLVNIFIVFVFFPYVTIIPIEVDTQPYAFIFSLLIFFLCAKEKFPKVIGLLLGPFFLAILMVIHSKFSFTSIRSLVNYASLFFIGSASYSVLKIKGGIRYSLLGKVIYIWFAVGFIQTFFYDKFLYFLLQRASTTSDRGVIGLAPEPTFYGLVCILLLSLVLLHQEVSNKRNVHLCFLLLIQIIFFSKSSMSVLLLMLFLVYYIITSLSFKTLRYLLIGGVFLAFLLSKVFYDFKNLRLFKLGLLVFEHPTALILVDASANDRFSHIFFSFMGFFHNFFMPHGFGYFSTYLDQVVPEFGHYFWNVSVSDRIMSGYGSAVFELGFVGLLIPLSINIALRKFFRKKIRKFLLFSLFLNTLLLTAIPLAMPYIGFLLGYLLYYANFHEQPHSEVAL